MSLIIHALTKGGFVAASDRCLTSEYTDGSVSFDHNCQKTYVFHNGFIVSFCGGATVRFGQDGLSVLDFLRNFDTELKIKMDKPRRLSDFCIQLLFRYRSERDKHIVSYGFDNKATTFLVSGPTGDPRTRFGTYMVDGFYGTVHFCRFYTIDCNERDFGAHSYGVTGVANAMFSMVDWDHISLKNAITLCNNVIRATSDTLSVATKDLRGCVISNCNVYVCDFLSEHNGWACEFDDDLTSFCREYHDLKYDKKYQEFLAEREKKDKQEPMKPLSHVSISDILGGLNSEPSETDDEDIPDVIDDKYDEPSVEIPAPHRPRVKKKIGEPYTKKEKLEIGRQIYDGEITCEEAMKKYAIGKYAARDYMRLYRDMNHLPPKNRKNK